MGVILKYQITFPEVGLKVSNDLASGDFLIDADIKAEMARGVEGSHFEIKLYDLPEKKAQQLSERLQSTKLGTVVIKLGYMDGAFDIVMTGLYSKVVATVEGDKLITTIKGLETGTHALQYTRFQKSLGDRATIKEASQALLKDAPIKEGEIGRTPQVTPENLAPKKQDVTLRGENLLTILDELARSADAEFLVCDKKLRIGKPIIDDSYQPKPFSYDVNLAVFQPFIKNLPSEEGDNRLEKLPPKEALGFTFIIAGDPKLRPAQKVFAAVKGYDKGVEFRVHSLVHNFTLNGGYMCKGVAVKICTDDNCRRQQDAVGQPSPAAIVQSLSQRVKDQQRIQPALEVAQVKEYTPGEAGPAKHRGILYFGQRFDRTETQPSMRAAVETDEHQLLRNKPLVSPFAWHKCGLVVPVYPGMKALLSHNLNLPDDALVTGFLWSEKPALEPPKNKTGDWWLCLPIDFDTSSPPSDSTKAANDLIANNGKRAIELKGLKITIGTAKLGNVGVRPMEGADDEFLIEHKKARIHIAADGSIEILADSEGGRGKITIASAGDIEMTANTNGGVKFKITQSGIEIS